MNGGAERTPVDVEGREARRPVDVAVGVLINAQGEFLLTSRPQGKVYAGYWEFPGGKIEAGESVSEALARELHEELGIVVEESKWMITQRHDYPHADVELQFFIVTRWTGEIDPQEGQATAWQTPGAYTVEPMLPALLTDDSRVLQMIERGGEAWLP